MNHEVLQTVAGSFPYIGTTAGMVVGGALVYETKRNLQTNRENAGLAAYEGVEADPSASRMTKMYKRLATPAIALVAFYGVGGGVGEVAYRSDSLEVTSKPTVEMVVDHSFEVSRSEFGGNGSVEQIDSVASLILNNKDLESTALVAHGEAHKTFKSAKKVREDGKGDSPSGGQSLVNPTRIAIENAFGKSSPIESTSFSSTNNRNAAVFIITDGNTVGSVKNVVAQAKSRGDVPVFVADTGSSTKLSDVATAKDLKAIANQPGGKYWHVSKDSSKIEKVIAESVKPQTIEIDNSEQRIILGLLAAMIVGTTTGLYRSMRDDTFNVKLK